MDSNNLLSFVNSASSNIQEALGKAPKRRRNVTVKKYAENRVKRLDSKKPRPATATNMTKRKSSQLKPALARLSPCPPSVSSSSVLLQHSNTWPVINTTSLSSTTMNTRLHSSSETNLNTPSSRIDPELENLLSELESEPPSLPISRHGSFESVRTTPSCTPPLNTLEAQAYVGEQAYSPYSDCSDEMDSAYCSPSTNAAQVSYCCSPTNLPDWCPTDLLPPLNMNATCMQEVGQGQGMISPRCNWVSQADMLPVTTTSSASVYDQGPPMTPTVSQLLEQYHAY